MLFEEYEAIRLCDYKLLNQQEAAEIMGVSRPTITRIYESARRKVATAFSEARAIVIEGGKVYFDKEWFHCKKCGSYFNNPAKKEEMKNCPVCNSKQISGVTESLKQ
jgi:rubrerythrin